MFFSMTAYPKAQNDREKASHPAAFSHTLAGWPLFTPMKNTATYCNNSNPQRWRRGRTSPPLRGPPRPFRGGIGFLQRM